jgi:MoaA/NifB/PqqE/SkfB family radical SAM enzyme
MGQHYACPTCYRSQKVDPSISRFQNFRQAIPRQKTVINELKKKLGSKTPVLGFSTVIMKRNIHELLKIIDLAAKLNISWVTVLYLTVFAEKLIPESLFFHQDLSNRVLMEAKRKGKKAECCR